MPFHVLIVKCLVSQELRPRLPELVSGGSFGKDGHVIQPLLFLSDLTSLLSSLLSSPSFVSRVSARPNSTLTTTDTPVYGPPHRLDYYFWGKNGYFIRLSRAFGKGMFPVGFVSGTARGSFQIFRQVEEESERRAEEEQLRAVRMALAKVEDSKVKARRRGSISISRLGQVSINGVAPSACSFLIAGTVRGTRREYRANSEGWFPNPINAEEILFSGFEFAILPVADCCTSQLLLNLYPEEVAAHGGSRSEC